MGAVQITADRSRSAYILSRLHPFNRDHVSIGIAMGHYLHSRWR